MKVAIIGGGPSAFGALARLVAEKQAGRELDIVVFTTGDENQEDKITKAYQAAYSDQDIKTALQEDKAHRADGMMPARRFFGQSVRGHMGRNMGRNLQTNIKFSDTFGGLGNYWSGSVFPAHKTSDPLVKTFGDLGPHYDFIAERMPITGPKLDVLSLFFEDRFSNHPPLDIAEGLNIIKGQSLNINNTGVDFVMGQNRFALNTHADEADGCIQCGDCLYGCPRDALFRAAKQISEFAKEGLCKIVFEKVQAIRAIDQKVRLKTDHHEHTYDRAYVCAGALESVNLFAKSYGTPEGPVYLYDNLLWYFPAFSLFPKSTRLKNKNFAFAELAGGIFDHSDESYNHLLISALPDAVMDKIFSRNVFSKALTRLLSRHVIIAAMYGSPEEYVRYQLECSQEVWKATKVKQSVDHINASKFSIFQNHLRTFGWQTSRRFVKVNDTSGHYTANLGQAYGIDNLAQTGVFDGNIFVCDSSSWNRPSMSQQHTFTIMANASKIVQESFSSVKVLSL